MSTRVVIDPDGIAKMSLAVQEMLNGVAQDIEQDAKRLAPVGETGQLRDGIEAMPAVDDHVLVRVRRSVPGDDPDVPVYVEFGTESNPAQPYMRPATYRKRALRGS